MYVALCITDICTMVTTKYASSPYFSGCQYIPETKSTKNNVGIIGNDMRIE